MADTTKAPELRPANAAAYNNRAWALHLKGEDALALPDAEKAVTLAPSSVPPLETRAEIYEKLGRRRDAVADCRAVLAIEGGLQLARDGLKRLGADPGNLPQAQGNPALSSAVEDAATFAEEFRLAPG